MKKLKLTAILLSVFLLTACGGVSKNPIDTIDNINTFNQKAAIFILKGVTKNTCESPLFRTALSEALTGVITKERPNSASCDDYSRRNNRNNDCYQQDYPADPGNLACAIGYNDVKDNDKNENILDFAIIGTIIYLFTQIAG
jgi:hypothetical protein